MIGSTYRAFRIFIFHYSATNHLVQNKFAKPHIQKLQNFDAHCPQLQPKKYVCVEVHLLLMQLDTIMHARLTLPSIFITYQMEYGRAIAEQSCENCANDCEVNCELKCEWAKWGDIFGGDAWRIKVGQGCWASFKKKAICTSFAELSELKFRKIQFSKLEKKLLPTSECIHHTSAIKIPVLTTCYEDITLAPVE